MRVLLPLLFLTVSASCTAPSSVPASGSSATTQVHWKPASIFESHLPPCSRLRTTRGSLCAIGAHESFWLSGSSSADRMSADEPGSVLVDATSWDKHCAELWVAKDGTLRIDADLGDGWKPRPMPAPVRLDSASRRARAACIAGAADTLVLYFDASIHRLERGSWSCVPLALGEHELTSAPQCALLAGRTLYLGIDDLLEGALLAIDIDSGSTTFASDAFPPGPRNVTSIALGPKGELYVTCREAPMYGTAGRLLVRAEDGWRNLLASPFAAPEAVCGWTLSIVDEENRELDRQASTRERMVDPKTLPPSGFLALRFDAQGRAYLLCSGLGLLRRDDDGQWRGATPGWAESGASACDFALVGDAAMLASSTAGVVRLDLRTLEGERVRLE